MSKFLNIISDFVNRLNHSKGEETNTRTYQQHYKWFYHGGEVFDHRVYFVFIEIGQFEQHLRQFACFFSHTHHLGHERRIEFLSRSDTEYLRKILALGYGERSICDYIFVIRILKHALCDTKRSHNIYT